MSEELRKLAKAMRDMSDMVGDLHWLAAKAVEGLIRLRGEIAKRDARIVGISTAYATELDELAGRNYALRMENAQLRAELAAPVQQVSVPDGWKSVPVNATEAILDVLYSNGMDESDSLLQDIWSAVIAAAPAAPAADAGLVEALDRIARSAASHIEQGERPDLVTVSHWARVAFSAIGAREAV